MRLDPKPVRDSMVEFARVMTVLDANSLGNAHGGVIMREVDNAGGAAASRHSGGVAVTAALDELSFRAPVHIGNVLIVKAAVNAVGKTSMEVGVRVEAESWDGTERRHTTTAYLTFVALDADGRPREVPELLLETEEEQRRHAQAMIRHEIRRERIQRLGSWRPERELPRDRFGKPA